MIGAEVPFYTLYCFCFCLCYDSCRMLKKISAAAVSFALVFSASASASSPAKYDFRCQSGEEHAVSFVASGWQTSKTFQMKRFSYKLSPLSAVRQNRISLASYKKGVGTIRWQSGRRLVRDGKWHSVRLAQGARPTLSRGLSYYILYDFKNKNACTSLLQRF